MVAYELTAGPTNSPGFLLWHVSRRWQALMAARLAPLALTPAQFLVLRSLGTLHDVEKQTPTQQRLADHAGTDPMMTSQIVRGLEERGLVSRAPDREDARAMRLATTASGRKLVMRAVEIVRSVDAELFDASMPREELVPILRALASQTEARAKTKAKAKTKTNEKNRRSRP